MKKTFLIFFTFAILFGSLGLVLGIPPEPMAFYGNVSLETGSPIPNGYYLTAKISGVLSGECEVVNGVYGMGKNTCVVESYTAAPVEFYLGDFYLGESPFNAKEIVQKDFMINSSNLPKNFVPISNGICEPEKGECSYNLLDCGSAITNVCRQNGVCDSAIGETCSNDPEECGVCPSASSGAPSSSGGGGGGGSVEPTIQTSAQDNGGIIPVVENYSVENASSGENNSSNTSNETNSSGRGFLTGFFISNISGSSEGKILLLAGGLILIGLAGLFVKKKYFQKIFSKAKKPVQSPKKK